ncbi:MAG: hypothetical protein ACI8QZ_004094 [Chlamydiales bacterium]
MTARTNLGWRLHAVLLALLVLQVGVWAVRDRSDEHLKERWVSGSTDERLDAAHVLLNRGPAPGEGMGLGFAATLLSEEPEARVRALAFCSDVCKLAQPIAQLRVVLEGLATGRPGGLIDFILQCRKVGGVAVGSSSAMRRRELAWYYRAREADVWPAGVTEEIDEHLAPWVDAIRTYLGDS